MRLSYVCAIELYVYTFVCMYTYVCMYVCMYVYMSSVVEMHQNASIYMGNVYIYVHTERIIRV